MAGIYAIKPWWQKQLKVFEDILVRANVHPDYITLAALALSVAGGIAFALSGQFPWVLLVAAPVVGVVRTALNALDGLVAKRLNCARAWGEVLNEFTDRLADAAILAPFAFSGLVSPHLAWACALLAVLSDDLGVLSKAAGGPRQYAGIMGKADRMIALAIVGPLAFFLNTYAYYIVTAYMLLVAAGSIATIVTRWRKTHADLR